MGPREELKFRAVLAEKIGRYEDMMDIMTSLAKLDMELTMEERNLLLVGYKKATVAKRTSLNALSHIEVDQEEDGNKNNMKMITDFRHKVEVELNKLCYNVIHTIDTHLLPYSSDAEGKVFYYQMKGDYYRYLAEFKIECEYSEVIDRSLKAYENASNIAQGNLSPAHPISLGLALNVSVFYYEMLDSPDRARQHAQQAFDDAAANLELLDEEFYNNSTHILQILGNNLSQWNLNSDMDVDVEHTQDSSGMGGASDHLNMDVGSEFTQEREANSGASGDTRACDRGAK